MDGVEILLFDPKREPKDWTDFIGPTQCAVFLKDRRSSVALAPDGRTYQQPDDTTCIVFDRVDDAHRYCDCKTQSLPHLRCEIYDSEGLAHSPLLVVVHPDHQNKVEAGSFWSRQRRIIAVVLFLLAPPLIWIDMRRANTLILPTFLAFNCILAGLRFLYWDFGVKHRERDRIERLEAHRRKERAGA